uniref:F-box domain-containing protein n=1 Tax=Odontella aurita TaxID=265563 RepID=A0A6U6IVM9_9STRA|mmetsp:Transcript_54120/g.162003  ORF Transcript_54120/g.162003 Transcript_54120/m.162003 type:complete len:731 (+) Transcript_54120:248-2440(+)
MVPRCDAGERAPSSGEDGAARVGRLASRLPAHILEWIVTYLPDDSVVATLPRVCGGWHGEIGKTSPDLWRTLLRRRGWSEPPPLDYDDDEEEGSFPDQAAVGGGVESERDRYRSAFVGHYSGLRDLASLRSGLRSLPRDDGAGKRASASPPSRTCASHPLRRAPPGEEECVAFRPWSPGRVLGAYRNEGTVSLFEASPAAGGAVACKQMLCVRTAPYPPSRRRRRRCELKGMDLDDDFVGCLFEVASSCSADLTTAREEEEEEDDDDDDDGVVGANETLAVPWLTAARRDDMLFAAAGGRVDRPAELDGERALRTFDLREAVVDFLLALENRDRVPDRLFNFLARNGPSRVTVRIRDDLVACGEGRFLFEAAVGYDSFDGIVSPPFLVVAARRLFLFSVGSGTIVWMGNTDPPGTFTGLGADIQLAGSIVSTATGTAARGARRTCYAVCTSGATTDMSCCVIPRNTDDDATLVRCSIEGAALNNAMTHSYFGMNECSFFGHRPAAVTASHIVVGHNALVDLPGGRTEQRAVLTFRPIPSVGKVADTEWHAPPHSFPPALVLAGNRELGSVTASGDSDHVIVLLRPVVASAEPVAPEVDAVPPEEDIQGEWFGAAEDDVDGDAGEEEEDEDLGEGEEAAPGDREGADEEVGPEEEESEESGLYAVLVHVPSRREVGWPVRFPYFRGGLCGGPGTLALYAEGRGVLLAGWAVRAASEGSLRVGGRREGGGGE